MGLNVQKKNASSAWMVLKEISFGSLAFKNAKDATTVVVFWATWVCARNIVKMEFKDASQNVKMAKSSA